MEAAYVAVRVVACQHPPRNFRKLVKITGLVSIFRLEHENGWPVVPPNIGVRVKVRDANGRVMHHIYGGIFETTKEAALVANKIATDNNPPFWTFLNVGKHLDWAVEGLPAAPVSLWNHFEQGDRVSLNEKVP